MYPSASAPAREPLSFPTRRSSDLVGGSVVHPFSVQDAVHGGVLDGAHTVPVYWYGKHKAASLFGSGPVFGFNANEGLGWIYNGGGKELYEELQTQILKVNIKS